MKTIMMVRGESAEAQRKICEQYAQEQGLEIVATVDNLDELTENILAGDFEAVLVTDASRLTRRYTKYLSFINFLKSLDIELLIVE